MLHLHFKGRGACLFYIRLCFSADFKLVLFTFWSCICFTSAITHIPLLEQSKHWLTDQNSICFFFLIIKLPSLIPGTLSPELRAVGADVLPGWAVMFPRVLFSPRPVVGFTSGCTLRGEASSLASLVEADAEPPWLVDASLAADWSEKAFRVVLVPRWLEELKRSGLVAGAGVTLLCVSFV